jgi:glutathionylspermidine synthase
VIEAAPALSPELASRLRRRAIFDHRKWDPQCGDVAVVAPFALRISPSTWRELASHAEALARELHEAEDALLRAPGALASLDLPPVIRALLATRLAGAPTRTLARMTRFDFHMTDGGWRISEANSDVPGGFLEASALSRLMLEHHPHHRLAGDPTDVLADAIVARAGASADVALVHATAYTDDRQAMLFLGDRLRALGATGIPCAPSDLTFVRGRASLGARPLDGIVRFFPAEWLPRLLLSGAWWRFFRGGETPVASPGVALVSQSKRFPLVWDRLGLPMRAWRALLPETRDPRDRAVDARSGEWELKPTLGRVGEDVGLPGVTAPAEWRRIVRAAERRPRAWIAQRAFETRAVATPLGAMYPCLGVFVIDGRAAGVYGRLGRTPLIDGEAHEAAVLIDERALAAGEEAHVGRA